MRLFKTRKSIDTFSSAQATQHLTAPESYTQHSSVATCASKFTKTISGSSSISSSLPDLHDNSPVMILSCTNLSSASGIATGANGPASVNATSNHHASLTAPPTPKSNDSFHLSPQQCSSPGLPYQQHLQHPQQHYTQSGRQTPSALSVVSLNDAVLQRPASVHLFNHKSNSLLLNYGGSSSNIDHHSTQNGGNVGQYQKFAQNNRGLLGQQQKNTSSSSSCIYEKSNGATSAAAHHNRHNGNMSNGRQQNDSSFMGSNGKF